MSDQNGPQYFNDKNRQLWEAADEYFAKAGSDSNENMRLIRPAIERLSEAVILVGFQWVLERIEREGVETMKLAVYGSPGELLDLRTFMVAETCVSQLKDMVRTMGGKAGVWLTAGVGYGRDEDEQALYAYFLVDFLSTLDPLSLKMSKSFLISHYDLVEGTSCKMSLAWTLYNMEETKLWENLVYGDIFLKSNFVKLVEQTLKMTKPNLSNKDVKDLVCRGFATGEYPELPFPIPETQKRSVLRVLALDIASNGRAFANAPHWTRKAKDK
jgi:hypothetical protein